MQQVNTKYYADQVAERYPDLGSGQVQKLCLFLMKQLYVSVAVRRYDISIRDTPRNFKIKIYKRMFDIPKANQIAKAKARRLKHRRADRALATGKRKIA